MKEYTKKQRMAKEQFFKDRGQWKWNDTWEAILGMNEDIIGAYSKLSSTPHKKGHLSMKMVTLIYIAIDASITHLYTPGMNTHITHGIKDLGITKEEVMETLAITTTIGAGTFTDCYPMFVKALLEKGVPAEGDGERTAGLRQRGEKELGYWDENLEQVAKLDPEMMEAYLDYLKAALSKNVLSPKDRELLSIAIHAAPTTRNREGVYRHVKRALDLGASKEEIAEVFDLVACNGIHTITVGVPVLSKVVQSLM